MSTHTTEICTYHSVTLQPGEQFNLPPGATIIGATGGLASFDFTCDKPTTLEEPLCYKVLFGLHPDDGGHTPFLQFNDNMVITINIQGVEYAVTSSTYPTAIKFNTAIATAGLTTMITGVYVSSTTQAGGTRFAVILYFKTIPSLASSINIHITGTGFDDLPGTTDGFFLYPQLIAC